MAGMNREDLERRLGRKLRHDVVVNDDGGLERVTEPGEPIADAPSLDEPMVFVLLEEPGPVKSPRWNRPGQNAGASRPVTPSRTIARVDPFTIATDHEDYVPPRNPRMARLAPEINQRPPRRVTRVDHIFTEMVDSRDDRGGSEPEGVNVRNVG